MADEERGGTLDALEATRVAAEEDYLAHVGELEARVARVLQAALVAAAAARQVGETPHPVTAATSVSIPEPIMVPEADRQKADQAPWPVGGGSVRAILNGLARWVLRDYLVVLDARHEALAERSRHLETDLDDALRAVVSQQAGLLSSCAQLNQTLVDLQAWTRSAWDDQACRTELLRDGLDRVGEAIDFVAGASLRLRTLINAKNAETVQRVMGGADQKVEVVLDALARRQEALLAELVGRRQELDELVAVARASD